MKEPRCPDCGNRLRKLGLENVYACDGTQTTIYWTLKEILIPCNRGGYPEKRTDEDFVRGYP